MDEDGVVMEVTVRRASWSLDRREAASLTGLSVGEVPAGEVLGVQRREDAEIRNLNCEEHCGAGNVPRESSNWTGCGSGAVILGLDGGLKSTPANHVACEVLNEAHTGDSVVRIRRSEPY